MRAGAKLPPSRLLAQELGVSRGDVVEAYAQLVAEGYLVARAPAAAARRIRYDLRPSIPDRSLFPRRAWEAAT
jgi:GntR family transcriptional regulator/MocR family aminotransferase